MSIMAIIPARGGSKGIPRKNMRLLLGKPLISYSIQAALGCKLIDTTVVSSDDDEILSCAEQYGATPLRRPPELSSDEATTESAVQHVLSTFKQKKALPDLVVLLQATSPNRSSQDIEGAIQTLINNQSDSLLSVVPSHAFLWKNGPQGAYGINHDYHHRKRRQDMEPEFRENGSIYVTKRHIYEKHNNRLGGKISFYVMDESKGHDIDSLLDFQFLEHVMSHSKES